MSVVNSHIKPTLVAIWAAVKDEPFGLTVRTSDPERTRQFLYRLRGELADPALAAFTIRPSSLLDEPGLVIVRSEVLGAIGRNGRPAKTPAASAMPELPPGLLD